MSTNHNFWRERRAEAVSNRGPSAYQPNALPLGQTGSQFSLTESGVSYQLRRLSRPVTEMAATESAVVACNSFSEVRCCFTSTETVQTLGMAGSPGRPPQSPRLAHSSLAGSVRRQILTRHEVLRGLKTFWAYFLKRCRFWTGSCRFVCHSRCFQNCGGVLSTWNDQKLILPALCYS